MVVVQAAANKPTSTCLPPPNRQQLATTTKQHSLARSTKRTTKAKRAGGSDADARKIENDERREVIMLIVEEEEGYAFCVRPSVQSHSRRNPAPVRSPSHQQILHCLPRSQCSLRQGGTNALFQCWQLKNDGGDLLHLVFAGEYEVMIIASGSTKKGGWLWIFNEDLISWGIQGFGVS